jgi:hypothetical protein
VRFRIVARRSAVVAREKGGNAHVTRIFARLCLFAALHLLPPPRCLVREGPSSVCLSAILARHWNGPHDLPALVSLTKVEKKTKAHKNEQMLEVRSPFE